MSQEQKKITKISGTSEEIREALKGNKVEIGLDIDGRDPKQVDFLREVLNKPSPNDNVDLKEENEDLRNKLAIIAEKRLDEKRKGVTDKINSLIRDPSRRAEMLEKLKTDSPEGVSAMDTTMKILEEQLANKNQRFETPAGSAPMNAQQMGYGQSQGGDIYSKKFPDYNSMIQALRDESKDPDKQKAQHANLVLNQLLNKYAVAQRNVHTEQRFCEDDSIVKSDKVPTVDFSQANESFSELERFGIRKSPLNYSKQRRIIAQKGDN